MEVNISGIVVPFAKENDSLGTRWDKNTDFEIELFAPHPVLFHHQRSRLGAATEYEIREKGLYARAVVDLDEEQLAKLKAGQLGWSSCTMPHLIESDESGYVRAWPLVEISIADLSAVIADGEQTQVEYVRGVLQENTDNRANWRVISDFKESSPKPLPVLAALDEPPKLKTIETDAPWLRSESILVSSPYDSMSLLGMALHHELYQDLGRRSNLKRPDDTFFRALVDKLNARKALDDKLPADKIIPTRAGSVMQLGPRAIRQAVYDDWHRAVPYLRANEANASTIANAGDEMVARLLNDMAYYYARIESMVVSSLMNFDMPSNPFDWPTVVGGLQTHSVGEVRDQNKFNVAVSAVPTSQLSTEKVVFSAGKLEALELYTGELDEDSSMNWSQLVSEEMVRQFGRDMDYVALYGDTTATGSNNVAHGEEAPPAKSNFLALDGLLKGTAAAQKVDMSSFTDESIIDALSKMGNRGQLGRDIMNLIVVVSPEVAYLIDKFDNYATMDHVGDYATLLTGQIGMWRGIPIIVSESVKNATDDGTVDGKTASNNTKGTLFVMHRNAVRVGFRRMLEIESGRVQGGDGRWVYGSVRMDVNQMQPGAVAVGHKIGI